MSAKLKLGAALAFAVVLSMALVACGGSGAASSSSAETSASSTAGSTDSSSAPTPAGGDALAGTWEMVAMSDGTEILPLEGVDEATRAKVQASLELNTDGSMVMHNLGIDMKGTWQGTSTDKVQLDFEDTADFTDISYTATLEDGTIAIEDAGLIMLLEKAE